MKKKTLIIKGGRIIDPSNKINEIATLVVEEGKIKEISTECDEAAFDNLEDAEIIDAKGCIVSPGLVDVHVHFRDPGFTYKEDIETGARAALKGGFTSVVLMANTKPPVDNEETLGYVIEKGRTTGLKVYTCATVTKCMKGQELTDMESLYMGGAVGFTDDGIPIMEEGILLKAMENTARLNVPISLHEENPALIKNNGVNKGKASEYFGIGGSPREAEISLIERDLGLAIKSGACLNIQHISTKEGVGLVRKAKTKSPNIHAEATPHHFSLTEEDCIEHGTLAKMNPPLREESDRRAIIEGIKDGTIDIIATDHAPHSEEEKKKSITEAPSGIIGLETALALGITNLVDKDEISITRLIECMSTNPAKMYNLNAGSLSIGNPADITIFNPNEALSTDKWVSKSQNSPFTGADLKGKITYSEK
jgi:dihydroorotase